MKRLLILAILSVIVGGIQSTQAETKKTERPCATVKCAQVLPKKPIISRKELNKNKLIAKPIHTLPLPPSPTPIPTPVPTPPPSVDASCLPIEIYTKNAVLAKIAELDQEPYTPAVIKILKTACLATGANQDAHKFVLGFLCAIHADTSFSKDEAIIEAIDNMEHIDLDQQNNLCEEINALP